MRKGYYRIECNNTRWICFYNGRRFVEEEKYLAEMIKNFPVEVLGLYKGVE